ncbi:A-kinase anchor protein 7-like [Enoplosus armatus]|uniref:A-kinase anchor protein 7-like n=1 Tax=Enoplosus armatus TaxID=215367 RepID=UPI0039938742
MLFGRVLLSPIRSTCSKVFCLQRVFSVTELSVRRLHPISTSHCHKVSVLKPSAHRFRLKAQSCLYQLTVCDMQPSNISYGKETTAVVSDDDDEGGGGGVVGQERRKEDKEVMIPGQMHAVSMEVQPDETDTGACTVSAVSAGSSEKKEKRKMRREKRKWTRKKLKSADTLDNLMSELPFSLTSPTAWRELGFPSPESTQKKRKRKRGDSVGRVDSEEDAEKKKKKESQRPNYFVSIPITNTQISSAVIEVREAVLQQEPRLAKAMIPVPTLHITLLVTHLANQEQVDLAATVLAQVEPSLAELLGGRDLVLPFSGIGHFRKEVVFVGLAPGQHRHTLDSLAELLRSRFVEQGLQVDSRGFEPHLTIMKLSRASKLRSQGIKRVDPALYSSYTNKFFGDQTVERVDLCSMLKKKQQDGYYHTETSLQLDLVQNPLHAKRSSGRRRSEPDEAELLRVSRRLVEDAVNRALQQYKQETLQNGGGPNATAVQPAGNTEETATKTDTTANSTADNRK